MPVLLVPQEHATIQEAVNAATPGDEIRVDAGNYAEWVDIPAGKDHLTIAGQGARTRLYAPLPFTGTGFQNVGNSGVTIRGFALFDFVFSILDFFTIGSLYEDLDCQAVSGCVGVVTSVGTTIRRVRGTAGSGVLNFNTFDLTLEQSSLSGTFGHYESNTGNTISRGNTFSKGQVGARADTTIGSTATGNRYTRNMLDGLILFGSFQNRILDCQFTRNNRFGLYWDGGASNEVRGCTAARNGSAGLMIAREDGDTVEANAARENRSGGLRLVISSNSVLQGNRLKDNDVADLIVAGGTGNTVAGNDCETSIPGGLCPDS